MVVSYMAGLSLAGVLLASAAGAAETPAAGGVGERRPARVALVSDTHTCDGAEGEKYHRHLERVVASVNEAGVDVVVITGDLTQGGKPEQIESFRKETAGFRAPVLVVPGNHDVGDKKSAGKPGGPDPERIQRYEAAMGPSFYVTYAAGLRLIGINTTLLGSGLPRDADQWALLEHELAAPAGVPTLLLMHYPPYVNTPDEPSDPYWNVEPEPRARLLKLAGRGGVCAILSGHLHRAVIHRQRGILFVTTPPVAFGLPQGKQPEGWTLVTVPAQGEVQQEFRAIPGD